MSGGVEQHEAGAGIVERRLFGEDRDAALALHGVGVEVGVAVVNAALPTNGAGAVEHGLGKRGLACVNMGEKPYHGLFHSTPLVASIAIVPPSPERPRA